MTGSGPLDGVLVIAIEQAVAGPLASRHLLDLGARVIKVERPGTGDFARHYDRQANGQSSHFVWLNRGKESIELDLKSAADRVLLWRMIGRADVVLQNLAPGSLSRLGLDADSVRGRFPGIVYASISGYGENGPYANRKAYDLLIQSDVGLLSITGSPDEPAKPGIAVADIAAGMYAFAGVLAALLRQQATGLGSTVRVSLLEALAEWMGYPLAYALGGEGGPARSGAHHATIAPYGPYPTSTGKQLFIAVQNDREWQSFCESVLADPALATDSRFATNSARVANRPVLEKLVTDVLARLEPEQAAELLDRAAVAYAWRRAVGALMSHPQLAARGRWSRAPTDNGPIPMLVPPITWDDEVAGDLPAVPSLGAHNEALRAEFAAEPESGERQLGQFPVRAGPFGYPLDLFPGAKAGEFLAILPAQHLLLQRRGRPGPEQHGEGLPNAARRDMQRHIRVQREGVAITLQALPSQREPLLAFGHVDHARRIDRPRNRRDLFLGGAGLDENDVRPRRTVGSRPLHR